MKQTLIKFPNGFRAVLSSRPSNVVTIQFSLLFGAEQEKKNMSGVTHFIERLLKSSIKRDVEKKGGLVESKTDYEHMEITISTVRENLEYCFDSLTKILFDFRPTYEKFKLERAKIMGEIENRKLSPLNLLQDLTQKTRYKTTSLSTELIGTQKTIGELTLEELRAYYNSILTPNQILLSVVGNIADEQDSEDEKEDSDEVKSFFDGDEEQIDAKSLSVWNEVHEEKINLDSIKVKKYDVDSLNYIKDLVTREFYAKTINLKQNNKRRTTAYFPLKKTTIITKNKNLNQSRFHLSLPSAPYVSAGYKYSKLFEIYLSNYLRTRLSSEMGLYGLNVYISQFKNNAHLNIVFAVDEDKAVDVYKKVIELLKGQRQESVTMSEFNSLVVAYKTMVSLGHEKMSDLAKRYNKWLFLKGEVFNLNKELKVISTMNFESFRDVSRKMINLNSLLVVYLGKALEDGALEIK